MKTIQLLLTPALVLAAAARALGQPVIIAQPQSQTNVAGTDATFSVAATGTGPLNYQWQFKTSDLENQTNTTLVLTNVQTGNAGAYTAVITNADGVITSAVATLTVAVPPSIVWLYPSFQSVSLGANPTFSINATGTRPIHYQWQLNRIDLPGQNDFLLALTNVEVTDAGDYTVVLTNMAGSVTSQVAHLEVDPTFTKITTGSIVEDRGQFTTHAWGDFNNDGFLDLFVSNYGNKTNVLYRNNGDGTFTKIIQGNPVADAGYHVGSALADFDNDGYLDLIVLEGPATSPRTNSLYRNNGDGTFNRVMGGALANLTGYFGFCAWADYDNDGWLDLFITNLGRNLTGGKNFLFHGSGDGTFLQITAASGLGFCAAWADYDNDGWMDLLVINEDNGAQPFLYHNDGHGKLTLVTTNAVAQDSGIAACGSWGDYNNDGFLDLFITGYSETNRLYRNNGNGTFTKVTSGPMLPRPDQAALEQGAIWGDYDNDGYLDLFVSNEVGKSTLFHNNGNGTFSQIKSGSPVNDLGENLGANGYVGGNAASWVDYDNDGFLDVFVARGGDIVSSSNLLYRNNGNSNTWLEVKCIGTASNRSAIGAKVKLKATIRGKTVWQLREITGGGGWNVVPLLAHFGLGDATNADIVRIEWPSGIVQTMTNVAAKQFLTVVEHQEPGPVTPPKFTNASHSSDGGFNLSVAGDTGKLYLFEASTNLVNWAKLGVSSNATGIVDFTDTRATNLSERFYRVSIP